MAKMITKTVIQDLLLDYGLYCKRKQSGNGFKLSPAHYVVFRLADEGYVYRNSFTHYRKNRKVTTYFVLTEKKHDGMQWVILYEHPKATFSLLHIHCHFDGKHQDMPKPVAEICQIIGLSQ